MKVPSNSKLDFFIFECALGPSPVARLIDCRHLPRGARDCNEPTNEADSYENGKNIEYIHGEKPAVLPQYLKVFCHEGENNKYNSYFRWT